jgi:hypothetical protein
MSRRALAALLATLPTGALAAGPDGSTPEQKAIVANDPPFHPQHLLLTDLPIPTAPTRALFDGHDLAGFVTWLGLRDMNATFTDNTAKPIGLAPNGGGIFSVTTIDGSPAIYSSGKIFGMLITQASYANYHLHFDYKFGAHNWLTTPRNSGVHYDMHGPYGAFFNTWMQGYEFQITPGEVGELIPVGQSHGHGFADVSRNTTATVTVGQDRTIAYSWRRFMVGGRPVTNNALAYLIEQNSDAEKPGTWNAIDLYVVGNASIHAVNGTPVLAAQNLAAAPAPGAKPAPLTAGRIGFESEGSEIYYRNITLTPIAQLPHITVAP